MFCGGFNRHYYRTDRLSFPDIVELKVLNAQLNYRPATRISTRVSRSATNRTLEEKARRSQIKRLRSKLSPDE
jgi:hypothetical protein